MKSLISISFLGLFVLTAWADDLPADFRPWTEVAHDADVNIDGMLTPKEIVHADVDAPGFRPFLAEHFMDLDTDDDGMISMQEIKTGTERMGMTEQESSEMFFHRAVYEGL